MNLLKKNKKTIVLKKYLNKRLSVTLIFLNLLNHINRINHIIYQIK